MTVTNCNVVNLAFRRDIKKNMQISREVHIVAHNFMQPDGSPAEGGLGLYHQEGNQFF